MNSSNKKKDPEHDISWDHDAMLLTRYRWRCKWYNTEFKEGEVTRLKQYLDGLVVILMQPCAKMPLEDPTADEEVLH